MYVLNRYSTATYRGWRTDRNEIHRFYFTDEGGSYAGAWGDYSAMGVIAVAAYAEQEQHVTSSEQPVSLSEPNRERRERVTIPASARINDATGERVASVEARAGTGTGGREHSSSSSVYFTAEPYPLEKHLYKYEWRETLCRKNIISCDSTRIWDDYAPLPPGHGR